MITERMQQLAGVPVNEGVGDTSRKILKALEQTWYATDPEEGGKPAKPEPSKFKGNEWRFEIKAFSGGAALSLKDTAATHMPMNLVNAVEKIGKTTKGRFTETIRLKDDEWKKVFKFLGL